jgi:biopolymer transport protein ExbD
MIGERMHLEDYEGAPVQFTSKEKSTTGTKSHIDMTPMVDVVFQLLTFFLLAVKRDSQEPLDVPVTASSTAVLESESTFITIKPALRAGAEPVITVGESRRGDGVTVTPDMIKAEVENGVHAGRPHIVVKAERLVRWGDVQKVTRIVASVTGAQLYVGVQGKD